MIVFSVSRLEKEDIRLEGSEPPEFIVLAGNEPFGIVSRVDYELDISKVSGGALVTGSAKVDISGECGRCLAAVSREVRAEGFQFFVETPPHAETCDISDDVRTEITLALPMNLLCKDDCRGLCPVCGADLNKKRCSCKPPAQEGSGVWSALDDLKL